MCGQVTRGVFDALHAADGRGSFRHLDIQDLSTRQRARRRPTATFPHGRGAGNRRGAAFGPVRSLAPAFRPASAGTDGLDAFQKVFREIQIPWRTSAAPGSSRYMR
jgi:hypothetical protein